MHVYGPAHIHGAHSIGAPHSVRPTQSASAARPSNAADELQLSPESLRAGDVSEVAAQINGLPEIRADRVSALREAIASGAYETADKLDAALDRLLDEIA